MRIRALCIDGFAGGGRLGEFIGRWPRAFGEAWRSLRAEYNRRGRQGYLHVEIEKDPWNLIHLASHTALGVDPPKP